MNLQRQKKQVHFNIEDSVQLMFAKYFASCYPSGSTQIQHDEIKQAFYAGIFAYQSLMLSDKIPDDENVMAAKLEALYDETCKFLKARME